MIAHRSSRNQIASVRVILGTIISASILISIMAGPAYAVSAKVQIAELETAMRVQREEAAKLRIEMDKLRSEHVERTAVLEESLDQMQRDLSGIRARLEFIEEQTGISSDMVDSLEAGASVATAKGSGTNSLADIERRITALEDVMGVNATPEPPKAAATDSEDEPASTEPAFLDPKRSYEEAFGTFKTGNYDSARDKFEKYLARFPDNPIYSDNAQFWIGETYYQQKNYERAILAYNKVIKTYPTADKVPDAYLKMGYSLLKLDKKAEGKIVLNKLVKDFPKSQQAVFAKKRLEMLP